MHLHFRKLLEPLEGQIEEGKQRSREVTGPGKTATTGPDEDRRNREVDKIFER